MNLEQILQWLTSSDGGALILVMWFVSWGLEEVDWWHDLPSKTRSLIVLGASAVIALVATLLQQRPDIVAALDVYFRPLYFIILAWLATQTVHKAAKAVEPRHDVTVVGAQRANSVEVEVDAPAYRGGSGAG